jgi:hypothetical protein
MILQKKDSSLPLLLVLAVYCSGLQRSAPRRCSGCDRTNSARALYSLSQWSRRSLSSRRHTFFVFVWLSQQAINDTSAKEDLWALDWFPEGSRELWMDVALCQLEYHVPRKDEVQLPTSTKAIHIRVIKCTSRIIRISISKNICILTGFPPVAATSRGSSSLSSSNPLDPSISLHP